MVFIEKEGIWKEKRRKVREKERGKYRMDSDMIIDKAVSLLSQEFQFSVFRIQITFPVFRVPSEKKELDA